MSIFPSLSANAWKRPLLHAGSMHSMYLTCFWPVSSSIPTTSFNASERPTDENCTAVPPHVLSLIIFLRIMLAIIGCMAFATIGLSSGTEKCPSSSIFTISFSSSGYLSVASICCKMSFAKASLLPSCFSISLALSIMFVILSRFSISLYSSALSSSVTFPSLSRSFIFVL